MKTKTIAILLGFLISLTLTYVALQHIFYTKQTTIRFGIQDSTMQSTIYIADKKGFFDDEGLIVELVQFTSGPPLVEAFGSDDLDLGFLGNVPAISSRSNGLPTICVANGGEGGGRFSVLVCEESSYQKLFDLQGQKIGLKKGSVLEWAFQKMLNAENLTQQEFEIINLNVQDMLVSLQTHQVEAVVAWDPYPLMMVKEGVARILMNASQIIDAANFLLVREKFALAHPDLVTKFLRVYIKACQFCEQKLDEAAQIMAQVLKTDVDIIEQSMISLDYTPSIGPEDFAEWEEVAQFLIGLGKIETEPDWQAFIDLSFLSVAEGD